MARPTVWRRTVYSPSNAQPAWRVNLIPVAPGETLTRTLCRFHLIMQGGPAFSVSAGWFAGIYAVDPEDPAPFPDPREPGSYPWLWHGCLRSRMLYDDPTSVPADATTTELIEPYEQVLDLHGQRKADSPGGLQVHFAAAHVNPFTGDQAFLTLDLGCLILEVP